MALRNIYVGCPEWGRKDWLGSFLRVDAKGHQRLEQYASVFNAVEGNTTFYGIPSDATVARWREVTPEHFRFCFKLPRSVTHERRLVAAARETDRFFGVLEPLGERLGPFIIQLPPSFGPAGLDVLEHFCRRLPSQHRYAVEFRHRAFFVDSDAQRRADAFLEEHSIDRVIFDTRGLHRAPALDEDTIEAQRRKPDMPVRLEVLADRPIVRFIGHPVVEHNDERLDAWARTVADWLSAGHRPHVFLHSANDFYAPALARRFVERLAVHADVGSLPGWPADEPGGRGSTQESLF